MPTNFSKTLVTFSATIVLVAASAMSSNARPHPQQMSPTQSGSAYHQSDPNTIRDTSCFSRSTGLPDQFACSSHGG